MQEQDLRQVMPWYHHLIDILLIPDPQKRYQELVQLHKETLNFYLLAVRAMTLEEAGNPGADGRLKKIVVAHIMAWEEWQIQVFTDSNKEKHLCQQMSLRGYFDSETNLKQDFKTGDDFNRYQKEKYLSWSWQDIQERAINTALKLQSLFPPNPKKEWLNFLNNSPTHNWKILLNKTVTIPAGWYLWAVSLEHEAVEHRKDLIKN